MPITEVFANCRHCEQRFSYERGRRGRPPIYCSPECCIEWNRANLKPLPAIECRQCGSAFHPARIAKRYQGIREIYCSAACRGLSQRKPEQAAENARRGASRRRAVKKGAQVENFTHLEVFERDRWKCGLCGKRVDRRLAYPDPMSASLDHIVPLCDGGEHSLRNSQCSHWICNSRKTFGPGGQMRLFG